MIRLVPLDLLDADSLPPELRGGAVAIGNFDGVHRGHARIAGRLVEAARAVGGPAVVLTFDPHPSLLLRPDRAPPRLTGLERKAELLDGLEVDALVVGATRRELLQLDPDEFFERVLVERLAARAIVEGPNFLFGRDRAGDIRTLQRLCDARGLELDVVRPMVEGDELVSSSRVRRLLERGDVEAANELLVRPYQIAGVVRPGARRGSTIGFPTANLHDIETLVPGVGVYSGAATVDGRTYPAAVNVGPNPTFGEGALKVEAHLPGWSGPLYDRRLTVDILGRLRDIQPFASVADLVAQLKLDVAEAIVRFERIRPTLETRSDHGA